MPGWVLVGRGEGCPVAEGRRGCLAAKLRREIEMHLIRPAPSSAPRQLSITLHRKDSRSSERKTSASSHSKYENFSHYECGWLRVGL